MFAAPPCSIFALVFDRSVVNMAANRTLITLPTSGSTSLHLLRLPQADKHPIRPAKLGQTTLFPCSGFLNPSFVQYTPDVTASGAYRKQHFGPMRKLQVESWVFEYSEPYL